MYKQKIDGEFNNNELNQYDTRRNFFDKLAKQLFVGCALLMILIIFSIIFFVGQQGLQTFINVSPLEFFLSEDWNPFNEQYGALSFISGSILVTIMAIFIGAPLGIFCAVFMTKVAPKWLYKLMKPAVGLYMAIPSVVYGYIGLIVLVPFIREFFGVSGGFGLFTAGIILGIMILPTVISISEDAIKAVPKAMEEASLAMGATYWQTIWHIVLPAALPGLMTAIILGMARAIGETMAVQMVIGNAPIIARSLFSPTSTLPSEIVLEMGNTPFGSTWNNSLFLMAFVLLLISLTMIVVIRKVADRKVA